MRRRSAQRKIDPPAPERLPAMIESLLFVADEPIEIGTLARSLGVTRQRVEKTLEALAADVDGRGLLVQRQGDRVQLVTAPDAAPYIEQFLEVDYGRLSRAALETLAIIAYRQPITRAGIEAVRGVNSDQAVATLLARGLIEEVGRAPGPGRPVLFGTTMRFLEYFGLRRPEDLPPLPELEEQFGSGATDAAPSSAESEGETVEDTTAPSSEAGAPPPAERRDDGDVRDPDEHDDGGRLPGDVAPA